jgi:hypothetical protein
MKAIVNNEVRSACIGHVHPQGFRLLSGVELQLCLTHTPVPPPRGNHVYGAPTHLHMWRSECGRVYGEASYQDALICTYKDDVICSPGPSVVLEFIED